LSTDSLPESVDWRDEGAVTPVKNQGACGSCWAFSTTGSVEGVNFINNGELISLSEQQLVDCAWLQGNLGCNGGMMDRAFGYVKKNKLETEDSYAYRANDSFNCKHKANKGVVGIDGHVDVKPDSADQLLAAVAKNPVSVALQADNDVFRYYKSGVVDSEECGTALNHGVLVVGYGTDEDGTDYWIVKNSWARAGEIKDSSDLQESKVKVSAVSKNNPPIQPKNNDS